MRWTARVLIATIATLLVAITSSSRPPAVRAETTRGIKPIGRLPMPAQWDTDDTPFLLQVDAQGNRIISVYRSKTTGTEHILIYRLSDRIPSIVDDGDLGNGYVRPISSPYYNALDAKRNRLLTLVESGGAGSVVQIIDLKAKKSLPSWNLWNAVPGYIGWGMTYSPSDDLVYVVGEIAVAGTAQDAQLFFGGTKPPLPAVILALNPADGSLVWQLTLPNCAPLNTWNVGTMIARSNTYRALYVPCSRKLAYPNLAGIQRIWIDPHSTTQQAARFRQEFFPISGAWLYNGEVVGIAAFDPRTDRIAMMSISISTPGAWVFDGTISGWVGFIPSPARYDGLGINQRTGHFYSGHSGSPVLVSSVRGTPIPQGSTYPDVMLNSDNTPIFTDPNSSRFFLPQPVSRNSSTLTYSVYEDSTYDEIPLPETNYDQYTSNESGPNVQANFVGDIRGFGVRIAAVGGFGGVWEGLRNASGGFDIGGWPATNLSPGDRALALADIPSIDLRNGGAASSAQSISPDTNTDEEHRTRQRQIAEGCLAIENALSDHGQPALATQVKSACATTPLASREAGDTGAPSGQIQALADECVAVQKALVNQGQSEAADAVYQVCQTAGVDRLLTSASAQAPWPWSPLTCLDGTGQKIDQYTAGPAGQGEAHISCDLGSTSAQAEVAGPGFSLPLGGASLKVGASHTSANATRGDAGTTTEITSLSRGLELTIPGVGVLTIAEARSYARAFAAGLTGQANNDLERHLSRVVLKDAAGRTIRYINECDLQTETCQQVLAQINSLIAPRFRLFVPKEFRRATPKGAFAGVQKAEAEYLNALNTENDNTKVLPAIELIVYNDQAEKSRFVVQLAGIQVNSIQYLTKVDSNTTPETIIVEKNIEVPVTTTVTVPGPVTTQVITRTRLRGGAGALAGTLALLARSPKEALHLAMIWVLFIAAGGAVFRRRGLRRAL